MWTFVVVEIPPVFHADLGVLKALEYIPIQALIAQPTVERFDERILNWTPWPNIKEIDSLSFGPLPKKRVRKLKTIVA